MRHLFFYISTYVLFYLLQKIVGDNWNFVEELLKLTCNPKVGAGSSFSGGSIEESYILTCKLN